MSGKYIRRKGISFAHISKPSYNSKFSKGLCLVSESVSRVKKNNVAMTRSACHTEKTIDSSGHPQQTVGIPQMCARYILTCSRQASGRKKLYPVAATQKVRYRSNDLIPYSIEGALPFLDYRSLCAEEKAVGLERPWELWALRGEGFTPEIADEIGCFELQRIYFIR